jgi:hypothetical protein
MVTIEKAREIALALPDSVELPHFELTSFRVNKKIFATMDESKNRMCLMFSPMDQSVFCAFDKTIIYPVPNKWGQKGATYVELNKVKLSMLKDMLKQAYYGKLKMKN